MKKPKTNPPQKTKQENFSLLLFLKNNQPLILFAFAFILYVQTIGYDYALDDKLAITENKITKKGIDGLKEIFTTDFMTGFLGKNVLAGGRYRPLTLAMFALEYEFFGLSPHLGHFLNVLTYALTALLVFFVLKKLFPVNNKGSLLNIPFIATLLFIAHPLHTEVVANIKSRDEIMCFGGALLSLLFVLKYLEDKKPLNLLLSGITFFLALLFKESAITFIAIIPLTIYFFSGSSFTQIIKTSMPALIAGLGYIALRYAILGGGNLTVTAELMNDPFTNSTVTEKYATIFYTIGIYLKLLVFPHPLTHDYYPFHIPLISLGDIRFIIPAIILVFLGIYALIMLRSKNIISYCILFFFITFVLFSNLFFTIGTFMNERFMYIPSLAFCICIAWLLCVKMPARFSLSTINIFLILILSAYSLKVFSRNPAWKNDYTLATTDVETSENSARANMAAGAERIVYAQKLKNDTEKKNEAAKAIPHLHRSLELYPIYTESMVLLGNAYFEIANYDSSIFYFEKSIQTSPYSSTGTLSFNNLKDLGQYATQNNLFPTAIKSYTAFLQYDSLNAEVWARLGEVYGKHLNELDKASYYIEKASNLDPRNTDILQKVGVIYAMTGQKEKSLSIFLRADSLEPNNAFVLLNIGIAYNNLGDAEKGKQYLDKAFELNPSLKSNQK